MKQQGFKLNRWEVVLIGIGLASFLWIWAMMMNSRPPLNHAGSLIESVGVAEASNTEFRVPEPGDPEYDDYQEMLKAFPSWTQKTPGYALPYDPEWRSVVRGRRDAEPTNLVFTEGERSMTALAQEFLYAVEDRNGGRVNSLRVSKDEFQLILWPEFPQSRPYLRIPPDEAWMFQYTKIRDGLHQAMSLYSGRELEVQAVEAEKQDRYTNFAMYSKLRIQARDTDTDELLTLEIEPVVVEREGTYKFLSF